MTYLYHELATYYQRLFCAFKYLDDSLSSLIILSLHSNIISKTMKKGKIKQARVGLAHRRFRTKIGGLKVFLKYKPCLSTALSSYTTTF